MESPPEIVTRPTQVFAGLPARFIISCSPEANNLEVIPKLWSEFMPRSHEPITIEPDTTYGLCDSPESLGQEAEHPHEGVYLAAVQVAKDALPPPGMATWSAAGGSYAKFVHRGPIARIGETMRFIYGEWLPEADCERSPGPDIERYDARFDPTGEQSVLEIYIPVRPKRDDQQES